MTGRWLASNHLRRDNTAGDSARNTAGPMKVTVGSLARELQLDDNSIIAAARGEGIYVGRPTDRIPKGVAFRIRSKYRRVSQCPAERAVAGSGWTTHAGASSAPDEQTQALKSDGLTADEIEFLLSIV